MNDKVLISPFVDFALGAQPNGFRFTRQAHHKTGCASVPDLPGVMAYGTTDLEAVRKVKAIALQVLADMIESGEEVPAPLRVLFAA